MDTHHNPPAAFAVALKLMMGAGATFVTLLPVLVR